MKTTKSFSKEEVTRRWYVVDLSGLTLGRAAARIATILRGKHKPVFTPHADTGDFVIAINASKVVLSGRKAEREFYRWHTGTVGNLKEVPLGKMLEEKPTLLVKQAVKGMLPKGPLGRALLRKLKVYEGPQHPHQAQKPIPLDLRETFIRTQEAANG